MSKSGIHQIANYVFAEQSTNIKIGKNAPHQYLTKVRDQMANRIFDISTLESEEQLLINLRENDIPLSILEFAEDGYQDFLTERRKLMAIKIKEYYLNL